MNEAVTGVPFKRIYPVLMLIVGLVGFADASYLTIKKMAGAVIPCIVTSGCETVTNSAYATFGPVPISLLGALYYLAIIITSIYILEIKSTVWLGRLANFTWVGFLFSIYLVSIMAFVLKSYCFYCLVSAATSLTLFVIGRLARSQILSTFNQQPSITPAPPI